MVKFPSYLSWFLNIDRSRSRSRYKYVGTTVLSCIDHWFRAIVVISSVLVALLPKMTNQIHKWMTKLNFWIIFSGKHIVMWFLLFPTKYIFAQILWYMVLWGIIWDIQIILFTITFNDMTYRIKLNIKILIYTSTLQKLYDEYH